MTVQTSWTLLNQYQQYSGFIVKFNQFLKTEITRAEAIYALNVAVEELITNIIKYNETDDIEIEIEISVGCNEIVLKITDTGPPFDPYSVRQVDFSQSLDNIPVGGLGLKLVRNSFDHFIYKRENEKNCYELIFILSADNI